MEIRCETKGEENLRQLYITLDDGPIIRVFASTRGYDGADMEYEVEYKDQIIPVPHHREPEPIVIEIKRYYDKSRTCNKGHKLTHYGSYSYCYKCQEKYYPPEEEDEWS